jgi:hypothetical protein
LFGNYDWLDPADVFCNTSRAISLADDERASVFVVETADSGHVERSSENVAAVPIPEDMLADRDLPLATRTYSQTRVRPDGCKSAKRARRMRDSAADGSEYMEAVKSIIGEWSATYAAVAGRSDSINSSQNEVSVALRNRRGYRCV